MTEKKHFLFKLYPPRLTFHIDANEAEMSVMRQHSQYWSALTDKGSCIVYGPVFDPAGVFGMAVIEVDSEEAGAEIGRHDPAVSSGTCTFELIAMQVGKIRGI